MLETPVSIFLAAKKAGIQLDSTHCRIWILCYVISKSTWSHSFHSGSLGWEDSCANGSGSSLQSPHWWYWWYKLLYPKRVFSETCLWHDFGLCFWLTPPNLALFAFQYTLWIPLPLMSFHLNYPVLIVFLHWQDSALTTTSQDHNWSCSLPGACTRYLLSFLLEMTFILYSYP